MDIGKHNIRKVSLTVLALGAASSAVVFGSLAVWTAQTTNPGNTVTAGELTLGNDKDATFVFDVEDVFPGETGAESVVISNDGSVPLDVTLTKDNEVETPGGADGNITADLDYYVYDSEEDYCYVPDDDEGACTGWADWATTQTDLAVGTLDESGGANDSTTFEIGWRYEELAGDQNDQMNDAASFDLTWDGAPS